jgi:hypothetical protein
MPRLRRAKGVGDQGSGRTFYRFARSTRSAGACAACRSAYAELVRDAGARDQGSAISLLTPIFWLLPSSPLRPRPSTNQTNLTQANLLVSRTAYAWPYALCPLPHASRLAPCFTDRPGSRDSLVRHNEQEFFSNLLEISRSRLL